MQMGAVISTCRTQVEWYLGMQNLVAFLDLLLCYILRSNRKLSLSKNDRAAVNVIVMLHKAHFSISSEYSCLCSHLVVPFGG